MDRVVQPGIKVENARDRSFSSFIPGDEPYRAGQSLTEKVWAVVNREFGPNVADVLTKKICQAVTDHVSNGPV